MLMQVKRGNRHMILSQVHLTKTQVGNAIPGPFLQYWYSVLTVLIPVLKPVFRHSQLGINLRIYDGEVAVI